MVYTKTSTITALILIHLIPVDLHLVAAAHTTPWYTHLVYMFFHANIFHLALNAYALWYCFSRWPYMLAAYVIAVLGSFAVTQPVVGSSAIVCAIWGMTMLHTDKYRWIHALLIFTLSFFIPSISWQIHLICFVLGLIYIHVKQRFS